MIFSYFPASQRSNADEEDGDGHFLSLSDMFVGILFIFIIVLMAYALPYSEAHSQLVSNEETRQEILEEISNRMKLKSEGKVQAKIRSDKSAIFFSSTGTGGEWFERGKSSLNDTAAKQLVPLLADVLNELLPQYSYSNQPEESKQKPTAYIDTVFIEGHADSTLPIGCTEQKSTERCDNFNLTLSLSRATNTYTAIIKKQPALENLTYINGKQLLVVSGYGDSRPLTDEEKEGRTKKDRQAEDRRIEIRVVMGPPGR